MPVDDPAMVTYTQTAQIPVDLKKVSALAVDADDRIYVAGDRSLRRFSPQGTPELRLALLGEPTCLAVANRQHMAPGRIYVGFADHVEMYEADGTAIGVLGQGLGENARFSSISTSEHYIFIADAGQNVVQRFDWTGKLLEPFGESSPGHFTSMVNGVNAPFDLVVGLDDLVYVVNRRDHRVEGYTYSSKVEMERHWGQGSPAIEDFAGISSPAHLALTADGRFVTAEEEPVTGQGILAFRGIGRRGVRTGRSRFGGRAGGRPSRADPHSRRSGPLRAAYSKRRSGPWRKRSKPRSERSMQSAWSPGCATQKTRFFPASGRVISYALGAGCSVRVPRATATIASLLCPATPHRTGRHRRAECPGRGRHDAGPAHHQRRALRRGRTRAGPAGGAIGQLRLSGRICLPQARPVRRHAKMHGRAALRRGDEEPLRPLARLAAGPHHPQRGLPPDSHPYGPFGGDRPPGVDADGRSAGASCPQSNRPATRPTAFAIGSTAWPSGSCCAGRRP